MVAVGAFALTGSKSLGGGNGPGSGKDSSGDLSRAEKLALPVTLFVLLLAFGAIVASVVTMLLALAAVVAAFGLLGRISQLVPLDDSVKTIVLLIGMAVGVDYGLAFVLGLAFVPLLVSFRSIVVPLKAIVLNLLSVAAAYGVLVLVFQHRWAEGILGFQSNGTIISWLPLFLFVVLFGLSMDYHVFILSRVREVVDDGMTSDDALRYGITRTAGVVTAAALVMVGVFSIFGTLSQLDVKQAGVGLAAAILIDATIIRAVLLPASMKLLGDWNWYLPRWLDRLPSTHHEAVPGHRRSAAPPLP